MQESIGWDSGFGLIVRFSSFPDIKLATESFDRSTDGIELLCVQKEGNEEYAVAWIPDGKLAIFEAKLVDYLGFRTIAGGKLRDSQRLIDSIREIRTAVIDDLWAGSTPIPDDNTDYKFEVWIGAPHLGGRRALTAGNLSSRVDRFRSTAAMLGLSVAEKT
ncbi:hypothetical protein, partial [Xanthomonas hortorum]|nr:hypothetical protein [Xanthomonas hortorum pv. taraxaci]